MAWGSRELELRVQDRTVGHLGAGRRRRAGFTVIETVVSVGVLSVLMSLAGLAMLRSSNAYQDTTQRTAHELRVRRALDRVIDELVMASAATITPPLGEDFASNTITFQPVVDIQGGFAVLGPALTLRTELAPGEVLNGVDDNGNGLVDEPGFSITQVGGTIVVRLSALQPDGQGRIQVRTVETSVSLRN